MSEAERPYRPPIQLLAARFIYDLVLAAADAATASSVSAVADGTLTVEHVKTDTVAQTAVVLAEGALRRGVAEEVRVAEADQKMAVDRRTLVVGALKGLLPR